MSKYQLIEAPITIDTLHGWVNNLDVREALRKYAPGYAEVFVNERAEIVAAVKSKYQLEAKTCQEIWRRYPGTACFDILPGMDVTLDWLRAKVARCPESLRIARQQKARGWVEHDGKKVLYICRDDPDGTRRPPRR